MGITRRVVSRSVSRAVGPTVWKAAHPVRTATRAITPAPVRKAKRMVYIATNPIGAAENAMVNSVFRSFDEVKRAASGSNSSTYSNQNYGYYVGEREAVGIESENEIERLFSVERERFHEISRPIITTPSAVPERPFYLEEMRRRKGEYRFYQRAKRKIVAEECWQFARYQAEAKYKELLEASQLEQAKADEWWKLLNKGNRTVVTEALKNAFADNQAPVIIEKAEGKNAYFLLLLPDIDVLPEKRMNITPTGRISSKKWTIAEKNEVYGHLLGAHLIATLREAWAVAPSLQIIRIVGIDQHKEFGEGTLFDVTVRRADGRWEDDAWGDVILEMAKFGLKLKGKSKEIVPWSIKELPIDYVL